MAEVRTPVGGVVLTVDVDEGQTIPEEEPIAAIETPAGRVAVITEVPGVVRELYVEPGAQVEPGDLLALIDET